MQETKRLVEHEHEIALTGETIGGICRIRKTALRELDVPIAELVPEKAVERAGDIAEL